MTATYTSCAVVALLIVAHEVNALLVRREKREARRITLKAFDIEHLHHASIRKTLEHLNDTVSKELQSIRRNTGFFAGRAEASPTTSPTTSPTAPPRDDSRDHELEEERHRLYGCVTELFDTLQGPPWLAFVKDPDTSPETWRAYQDAAEAVRPFVSDSSPTSRYSADDRARFWRTFSHNYPGAIDFVVEQLSHGERAIVFGCLLRLQSFLNRDRPTTLLHDLIEEEDRSSILYFLLSTSERDASNLIAVLKGIAVSDAHRRRWATCGLAAALAPQKQRGNRPSKLLFRQPTDLVREKRPSGLQRQLQAIQDQLHIQSTKVHIGHRRTLALVQDVEDRAVRFSAAVVQSGIQNLDESARASAAAAAADDDNDSFVHDITVQVDRRQSQTSAALVDNFESIICAVNDKGPTFYTCAN